MRTIKIDNIWIKYIINMKNDNQWYLDREYLFLWKNSLS